MPSRKNPSSAAPEETIGRVQEVIEIAVQLAPLRTAAEAHRPVGSAASGRRSRCVFSTLSASARRGVALGLLAGCFVFLSAQTRSPFTQHEKAIYCIHYESHLVPFDTKVSYPLNPNPLQGGVSVMITGSPTTLAGGETHRRFHGEGCQGQPAFHLQSEEPEWPVPLRITAKPASG